MLYEYCKQNSECSAFTVAKHAQDMYVLVSVCKYASFLAGTTLIHYFVSGMQTVKWKLCDLGFNVRTWKLTNIHNLQKHFDYFTKIENKTWELLKLKPKTWKWEISRVSELALRTLPHSMPRLVAIFENSIKHDVNLASPQDKCPTKLIFVFALNGLALNRSGV